MMVVIRMLLALAEHLGLEFHIVRPGGETEKFQTDHLGRGQNVKDDLRFVVVEADR